MDLAQERGEAQLGLTPEGAILEAAIFAADFPVPAHQLAALREGWATADVRVAVEALNAEYERAGHAFQIVEVAGGFQMVTRPEFSPYLAALLISRRRVRLSQAALETLAIVAYRQPVARPDMERIRGVNVEGVLRTLMSRNLITVVGRDTGVGRPLLYGTTKEFLNYFGLKAIGDLPSVEEVRDIVAAGAPSHEAGGDPAGALPGPGGDGGAQAG